MARSTHETLTAEEHGTRVTGASAPIPVEAWVRFAGRPEKVTAAAVAWTDVAVRVAWVDGKRQLEAWVWANAIRRI